MTEQSEMDERKWYVKPSVLWNLDNAFDQFSINNNLFQKKSLNFLIKYDMYLH